MSITGRSGNYFRSFTFEEGQYGICFHRDSLAIVGSSGAGYCPFLGYQDNTQDQKVVA